MYIYLQIHLLIQDLSHILAKVIHYSPLAMALYSEIGQVRLEKPEVNGREVV